MDLSYGPEYEALRREVRAFATRWPEPDARELRPLEQRRLFWQRAVERGWAYRDLPSEYGGSARKTDPLLERVVQEEVAAAGVPAPLMDARGAMIVHTLLDHGTEAQRQRFVRATVDGEIRWCQGYSEPGAGSDLASLQTRAQLDGDHWVVNGQKIWTSGAHHCQYMFGLFRTEPEASKHAGISYLLVDMTSPGIEIAPMQQMDGSMDFNQVFFQDVRVPADHIVGRRGEGWNVSRSTLKYERAIIGNPNMVRDRFEQLVELARRPRADGRPAIENPAIRQRLAQIHAHVRCAELSNLRSLSARARGQEEGTGLLAMMGKLYGTDTTEKIARLAYDLVGADGLLAPTAEELKGFRATGTPTSWVRQYIYALGPAIAGGASNIQRNIIGERGLGMPRDLRAPRD